MSESSRQLAQTWGYPRHADFEGMMRTIATRWFKEKNLPVQERYPFILNDRSNWERNIILPVVADFIRREQLRRQELKESFPLHKYLHHGLSSQAMLFNLLGPLNVRDDWAVLQSILTQRGIHWPRILERIVFEFEDRGVYNEDIGQPTSFDLAIEAGSGEPGIFFEAKFVEREFGGCSVFANGDCDGQNPSSDFSLCYLNHIGRLYWKKLDQYGFIRGPVKDSPVCVLSQYYQFFRELIFAIDKQGYFILLLDPRNPSFFRNGKRGQRGLVPFLTSLIPEVHRQRIKTIHIQDVVQSIKASGRHMDWIGEFELKYGLTEQVSLESAHTVLSKEHIMPTHQERND